MKKLLSLITLALLMFVMPFALAEEAGIGGGVDVGVDQPDTCSAPDIHIDHTARGWYPNDQTYHTADRDSRIGNDAGGYGVLENGGKYSCTGV